MPWLTNDIHITLSEPEGEPRRYRDGDRDGDMRWSEWGDRPLVVELDADCPDCGKRHDIEHCPVCGWWIEVGYGLMFGGLGSYKYCAADGCSWFWKRISDDEGE